MVELVESKLSGGAGGVQAYWCSPWSPSSVVEPMESSFCGGASVVFHSVVEPVDSATQWWSQWSSLSVVEPVESTLSGGAS